MATPIAARLQSLQTEYESGQKMLAELDAKRTTLINTLLRIEGAIQVLKELSTPADTVAPPPALDASAAPSATA